MRAGVHNFDERNRFSVAASGEAFWGAVYRKAFPGLASCPQNISGDNAGQHAGVDRFLNLSNGKTLLVDEKKREKDYADVALEYLSNDRTRAPGWIEKDLAIDYLAYAFMPSQRCYLFAWPMLRRAWLHHRERWMAAGAARRDGFRLISAPNATYNTLSLVVPIKTLRDAVSIASVIQVDLLSGGAP